MGPGLTREGRPERAPLYVVFSFVPRKTVIPVDLPDVTSDDQVGVRSRYRAGGRKARGQARGLSHQDP